MMYFPLYFNRFLLITTSLLLFTNLVFSQDECELDTFIIEEAYFNEDIVGYYLAALDLNSGSSTLPLFEYIIKTDHLNCYSNFNILLYLKLSISIYSPQLGFNEFEMFISSKFKFSEITSPLIFNNTDMNFNTNSIPGAKIEQLNFELSDGASDQDIQSIINVLLQSGKIPNGIYAFEAILSKDESGTEIIDQISKLIDVYQPQYINLISPGGSISDTLETQVFNPYPIFNWESDNCTSTNCGISIRLCEYDPNNHSSLSDALQSNSLLPISYDDEFLLLESSLTSFQYPFLEAQSLVEGKYYVWQLKRTYETTIGAESLFSNIFVFKLYSEQSNSFTSTLNIDIIKGLIGDDNYDNFFGSNGELKSFTSAISLVTVDDQEIPLVQLYDIINKIEQNQINIIEVKSK